MAVVMEATDSTKTNAARVKSEEWRVMKKRIVEIAVKVVVAALTAFLTAITTTSCMGLGPIAL